MDLSIVFNSLEKLFYEKKIEEIKEEISKNDRIELTNLYLKFIDDNTIYLDPHNYFCSDSLCSIIDLQTNEILFSDLSPHISINGKRIMDIFWSDNFTKLINLN